MRSGICKQLIEAVELLFFFLLFGRCCPLRCSRGVLLIVNSDLLAARLVECALLRLLALCVLYVMIGLSERYASSWSE